MALEWLTLDLIVKVLRACAIACGALLVLAGVLGISKYDKLTEMFLQVDDLSRSLCDPSREHTNADRSLCRST